MQASFVTRSMQANLARMAELQEQGTSGRKLVRASSDPSAAANALSVRNQLATEKQYQRNIENGDGWLSTLDSALTSVTDVVQRVRDLVMQGASDTASPDAREAIAVELDELRSELLRQSNTTFLGRSVFAGTSDEGVAFRDDYTFTGVPGSSVERRIGADSTVQVDVDGAAVFGTGTGSVFALLDTVVADLRAGTNVSSHLGAVDARLSSVLTQHTAVGARQNQLERATDTNADSQLALTTQRAGIEDADLAEIAIDLQLKQVAYQATLSIGSNLLQPTLMDYLR
ncbi:flagellar hook-associated protein 3 [Oerskovia turbata]|uniref:Flagellar hook-associated protein 3 n=2 Tax=Oerskovia turbata TaxID=1713 RepID=A0A4Q1KSK5_9CELL|nr:flagellar hook-associated protein 3 [Oerskovia turbata]RXR32952.1 flagellar hook-associated protein 3 [Oerskovia turbata]TGJ95340.1 flagellar hook-associated protein 3 [Actinotalea fermentans ATCC 43279 = JCM 9966 = DSM 3133]